MIAQVIFRIRQPKAYRPLTNDDIKWFKVDHTSATDISLRRPAPEVSVRSTCCIRQKTKKAEKMSIKFKPQYIYEEVLYEKNSEKNCPKSLTLMQDKFCKSHNAADEIISLQEHGYKVLLRILFYSSIIASPVTTLLVGFKTASWLSKHLEVMIYFFSSV